MFRHRNETSSSLEHLLSEIELNLEKVIMLHLFIYLCIYVFIYLFIYLFIYVLLILTGDILTFRSWSLRSVVDLTVTRSEYFLVLLDNKCNDIWPSRIDLLLAMTHQSVTQNCLSINKRWNCFTTMLLLTIEDIAMLVVHYTHIQINGQVLDISI